MSIWKFGLTTDVRAGEGAALIARDHARDTGAKRVTVILDAGVRENSAAVELIDALREVAEVLVLENAIAEPSYDDLDEFRTQLDAGSDLFVGIGGGSTLDLAKAMSVLVVNPKPAIEYRGFDLIETPGPPLIAIPTTAGTGSEVTPNAVFTDKSEGRKFGINTTLYLPVLALLDPRMIMSAPRSVTVSAGMDALVHSVESFVARAGTPLSQSLSREGFRRVMRALPLAVEQPNDAANALDLQVGAFLAGSALMNAGAGPAGALSYPLGARFGVPHGIAGGFFLAPVALRNVAEGAEAYAGLADLLPEPPPPGAPALERSRAVAEAIAALARRLDVPVSLDAFDIGRGDIPMIVEQTFLLQGALDMNPVPVGSDYLTELLEEVAA